MPPFAVKILAAIVLLATGVAVFGGCGTDADIPATSIPVASTPVINTPAPAATAAPGATPTDGTVTDGMVQEVSVGPERVECQGVAPQRCLVVDGLLFYSEIEGFEHEPGYEYRLRIERYDAWPGQAEPPADAASHGYRLLEIISKTPAGG